MGKPLLVMVYYNGRIIDIEGIENGVRYDGPPPKPMMIKNDMTFDGLKKKNHSKLRLGKNQFVSRVRY